MPLLLGIDVGTTGTKAAVFDLDRGLVAEASRPVALSSPRPGWAEADAGAWWENTCSVVRELVARVDGAIAAVATSGMVPAVAVLDGDARPLRPVILQNDARAVEEIGELSVQLERSDLLRRTGSALTQQSVAPTLRWLQRHEPETWQRTRSIGGSYDWLARTLGAEPHVELNWAIESGLWELGGGFAGDLLAAANCPPELLPPVREPGEVVGHVSDEAAVGTGLPPGTPIVVGGADHVAAAFAAGLVSDGDWLIKLGGAGDVLVVSEQPVVDGRLYLDRHIAPGRWLPNGCMATSGSLLRWFQAEVAGGEGLAGLDADAEAVGAGSGGVVCLPYMLGEKSPIHDPLARGAFIGLHLGHRRGHLYRACLEAVAFGVRHHMEVFRDCGLRLGTARVTNGGSGSTVWKQIVADICRVPVTEVLDHSGASLGAAFAAGVGIGAFSWDAIGDVVRLGKVLEPKAGVGQLYDDLYGVYRALEPAVRQSSHRLASLELL